MILIDKKWNNNLRLFSLSGNIKKPGIYELPLGTPVKEILEKVQPKNPVKALYFGCADGCIPPEGNLEPEEIKDKCAVLGNCGVIVVDNKNDIVDIAKNIAEFFVHESCGKCTPCREGTFRILEILEKISDRKAAKKDLQLLEELADLICETSFCGLGKVAANHIKTALKYFRKEFEDKCRLK